MTENPLFLLNSVIASWLNPSFTTCAMDMILAFVGGLGLFLLLLPWLQGNSSFPPPRKKEKHKHPKMKKGQNKNRKKSSSLKDYRDCWKKLEEIENLVSLLQSHLGRLHDHSRFHHFLKGDDPDDTCKPETDRVYQSRSLPGEDALATAFFPLASLASGNRHPVHLASTSSKDLMTSSVSAGSPSSLSAAQSPESMIPVEPHSPQPHGHSSSPSHPPDLVAYSPSLRGPSLTSPQCDSMPFTVETTPQSSSSPNGCLPASVSMSSTVPLPSPVQSPPPDPFPSPILSTSPGRWPSPVPLSSPVPVISDDVLSTYPISSLPCWQMPARDCCLSPGHEDQKDHVSHPPEASYQANQPLSQTDAEGTSFINTDVQRLLEILNSKTEEQKIYNGMTKGVPGYPLNSLGSTVKLLGREQDNTIPQPWNTKGKSEQLSFPQQLFYNKVLGDHLQKKYSQCFWGLPILHSESLVATVSRSGHSEEFSSILFNELPNDIPVQVLPKPTQLFPSQFWLHPIVQLQPVTPTFTWSQSQSLVQIQNQNHFTSSIPSLPPHLPLNMACEFSYPTSQEGIQLLSPSDLQHLDYHLLRKQVHSRETLPYLVQTSQNLFSHLTSENRDSHEHKPINKTPGDFISLELREKLEQHLQKRFIQQQYGLPPNIYQYLKLKEFWEKVSRTGQARNNFGSSCTSVFTDDISPDVLDNRPEIIQKGMIPVGFYHSRLGIYHASAPPGNTHKQPGDVPYLEGEKAFMNTSQELSLLDVGTWQVLEAHVTRQRVRHRWGLPLKVLKHMNLFRMKTSVASPLPQPLLPFSTSCNSRADSIAHINDLRKCAQKGPELTELAKTSVPTLMCPVSGPSFESLSSNRPGDICGLPHAPSPIQEGSLPSQPHSYVLVGRTWHSNDLDSGRDSLEPIPNLETGSHEPLGSVQGSCHSISSLRVGSQFIKSEIREIEDDEECSDWEVSKEMRKTTNTQSIYNNLGKVESQGIRKSPSPFRSCISHGQGYSWLKAQSDSQNQSQGLASDVILQDYATDMLHQDCASEVLLPADMLASQERLSSSLGLSSSSVSTSQGMYGQSTGEESRQDLQEPKIHQLQDPRKTKKNKFRPMAKREDSVCPRSQAQQERLAGERPSCAREMSTSAPVMEVVDTVGDKSSQAPPKRNFGDRIKNFLQHIFLRKGKGQAITLSQIMTPSISTQHRGSPKSQLFTYNKASVTKAHMTTIGWIIEQEMRIQHDLSAYKKSMVKQEHQVPVGRQFHYSRGLSSLEQRRVIRTVACGHQASPSGHSPPVKRCIRNDNNTQALLAKESAHVASPCQHRLRMAGISGHNVHCPRHCALQRHLFSSQQLVSHSCPAGAKFSH